MYVFLCRSEVTLGVAPQESFILSFNSGLSLGSPVRLYCLVSKFQVSVCLSTSVVLWLQVALDMDIRGQTQVLLHVKEYYRAISQAQFL